MPPFTEAISPFSKNGKHIIVLRLDKNYLEAETTYLEQSQFRQYVYGSFPESALMELEDNMNNARMNYSDIDVFIFINHGVCNRGRDMVAAVACLDKIKDQILSDPSI